MNLKALLSQPDVTTFVGKLLLRGVMARPVNLDNQSMLEAYKIDDIIAERDLPLELCAITSPIANRTPDERLRLNGFRPLFAGETAEKGARDFLCHDANLRNILRLNIRSHRALRDPPHPSLLRNDTFPRKGGRKRPFRSSSAPKKRPRSR